jgi:hypothetical protein
METILELHRYLSAAVQTVNYVEFKMDIGPSNKLPQSYWGWPARTLCVAESRKQMYQDLKRQTPALKRSGADPMKAKIETWANWAASYGCGNCGEQSAVAFVQLRDIWKIFPIDFMQTNDLSHAFVVLGRIGITNPAAMATWNAEAVVCDPYYGEAIEAASCARLRGKKIQLIYRDEGPVMREPGTLDIGAC